MEARDFKIDGLKWLKDESMDDDELQYPEEIAAEVIAELVGAVGDLNQILRLLEGEMELEEPAKIRRVE